MVKIRICPKCESADLARESSHGMSAIAGVPPMYVCQKCGHAGMVFPEIDEKEYEKMEKKRNKK